MTIAIKHSITTVNMKFTFHNQKSANSHRFKNKNKIKYKQTKPNKTKQRNLNTET